MNYRNNQIKELKSYLNDIIEKNITIDDALKKIKFKDKIIKQPYFRKTKSNAIACYGVKREPIVLYRTQWMKLAKVFIGGENCHFNNFFHKEKNKRE